MYDHYIWFLRFNISQQRSDRSVVIRLSSAKKLGIRLNVVRTISDILKVSLTNSFLVVQEKKWPVTSTIRENSGRAKGQIWVTMDVGRYFDPWYINGNPLETASKTQFLFTKPVNYHDEPHKLFSNQENVINTEFKRNFQNHSPKVRISIHIQ